ncbi:unnamed protein product [Lymnaea stagnalis]|uniref:Malate dehydrogenase, cytoplasmic n=1 Tax=Lymnaea stagnalis TaxID=6523 RepID=A0AAV2I5F2_LYMST
MAKIVIAGRSDCPYFARIELLADRLAKNLKKFKLHKIMVQPNEWEEWLKNTCAEKGWEFSSSPMVWRELIDRGGKGVLIGGANEFQEYIKAYYDLESEMNSYEMTMVGAENRHTKDELDAEEKLYKSLSRPVNVCITNAIHPVCYHLLHNISSGNTLGPKVELRIHLLVSLEEDIDAVKGIAMEAEDLAHSLLRNVKVFTDPNDAFENCNIIIFLDELLRQEDEYHQDWLIRNEQMFSYYGSVINDKASKNCKVLVCGNGPVNFNATMIVRSAPNIARQNVVAVATVIENQAKSIIGEKLSVNPAGVVSLLVWGNINGKRYFDVSKCRIHGYDGAIKGPYWYTVSAMEMLHDNKWVVSELPGLVASRHIKVARVMGRSTSLSTANSIATLLQHWYRGSPHGELFSLGVYSEGWYGVPPDIFFSFPVTMDPKGYWHVVQDIFLTSETKNGLKNAIEDLVYEIGLLTEEFSTSKEEEAKSERSEEPENKSGRSTVQGQKGESKTDPKNLEISTDLNEDLETHASPDITADVTAPTDVMKAEHLDAAPHSPVEEVENNKEKGLASH